MKLFTLYVGCDRAGCAVPDELGKLVGLEFESFTMVEARGVFRGCAEPTWLVTVASDDVDHVLRLAERIRSGLQQDGVGVEHAGNYFRCTARDRASELQQLLRR